jgi:hypothetical protein
MKLGHPPRVGRSPIWPARPSLPAAMGRSPRTLSCRHTRVNADNAVNDAAAGTSAFGDIRSAADEAFKKARALFPELEEAELTVSNARQPAADAERCWQDAHARLADRQGAAAAALSSLRADAVAVIGGEDDIACESLRHHVTGRLDAFVSGLEGLQFSRRFPCTFQRLDWLPGATMTTQAVACIAGDKEYMVACVAVSGPLLQSLIAGLLLHW